MNIVKRDKKIEEFDKERIYKAIEKAMKFGSGILNIPVALKIANEIEYIAKNSDKDLTVQEVESLVFNKLIEKGEKNTARAYEGYRSIREYQRNSINTIDESLDELLTGTSEYWSEENSNKNAELVTTVRDYMAGIVSTDITRRKLLPPAVVQAHDDGIIHFHDADYFAQLIHNCDLVNLEDMLQNGTVISGVMIEKPHSFSTACNVATQIIAQVASSQYGGQSVTLAHLAPFVQVSREAIRKEIEEEHCYDSLTKEQKDSLVEKRLRKEINRGVQTIQYQVVTLMTTNGQAPFLTVFMYLNEAKDEQTKADLAIIIEEVLNQRYQGVKNEQGVWVTPAFPKLIYVTEEDNIYPGSKYYYLTELAAKCSCKRMVPDYISEKMMLELKVDKAGNGNVYPCMGCCDGKSVINYRIGDEIYVESFNRAWERISKNNKILKQLNNEDEYIQPYDVSIWDTKRNDYVKVNKFIRNTQENWVEVSLNGGRYIDVTIDHPFEVIGKGVTEAKNLKIGDKMIRDVSINRSNPTNNFNDIAWLYGVIICDGSLSQNNCVNISLGIDEIEVVNKVVEISEAMGFKTTVKERHREEKGNYYDVNICGCREFRDFLVEIFGGVTKDERHIPTYIFNSTDDIKLSFLAGMIDADGYINNSNNTLRIQIGSVNQELAIEQGMLAQSLGYNYGNYLNHYNHFNDKIRYRIEFNAYYEFYNYLVCTKKKNKLDKNHIFYANTVLSKNECSVQKLNFYKKTKYSYDVETESEHFTVNGIYSHNCRSFLTPYIDDKGNPKYYGRFNQGVVTINLVDLALSSGGDFDKFWELFEIRTELCHIALRARHERLKGTPSDVAPILWQHGALARLKKGETIDKLLYGGYSTISLGYAGLYECVKYMTGNSHTDNGTGKKFGLEVMQALNDKTAQWKAAENIDYSLYGTPIESTTYKFAKKLKERFGIIPGITDKDYVTNSYHVHVTEPINAFDKLALEAEFQKLSPGGAISYVELPNIEDNVEIAIQIIQFMYENILYAELNIKSDYCMVCGYDKEIKIVTDPETGRLEWECPNCGNRDQSKMSVARRTCGYIGSQYWCQGRTMEIRDRITHIDDKEYEI